MIRRYVATLSPVQALVLSVGVSLLSTSAWGSPPAPTPPAAPTPAKKKVKPQQGSTAGRPVDSGAPRLAADVAPFELPQVDPAPGSEAVVDGAACVDDRVNKIVQGLGQWSAELTRNERATASERGCDEPNVICLDRTGQLASDVLPARLVAGANVSVYGIVPAVDRGRVWLSTSVGESSAQAQTAGAIEVATAPAAPAASPPPAAKPAPNCSLSASQRDALKVAAMPIAKLGALPGLEALGLPAEAQNDDYWSSASPSKILADWSTWSDQHGVPAYVAVRTRLQIPTGEIVVVRLTRTEAGSKTPSLDARYEIPIDNGRYYVEPALLVPFVYKGLRTIELDPTPSNTEIRVNVKEAWHVTGSAMVNVFPLGRQRGHISSFYSCRSRSCFENWFGLQVGVGLDSVFRDWYAGVVFEPISGVSFNLGTALLKGEFLPEGRAEGMLLPSPQQSIKYSDYMFRPYFGFSFTLDIFETLDRGTRASGRLFF